MTRIKYTRKLMLEKFMVLEAGPFLAGANWLSVTIRLDDLTYHIYNSSKKMKEGNAKTLTSVKKKVKLVLKELGVVFHDEIRNRGKTEKL